MRLAVVVVCLAAWPARLVVLRWRDLAAPALALAVVGAGWLAAPNRGLALEAGLNVLLVVMLYASLLVSENHLAAGVLRAATYMGLIHAAWAVIAAVVSGTRAGGGFFNPNDLAALLAPLVVMSLARERRRSTEILGLLAGLAATASRSGILAVVLGLLALAVGRTRRLTLAFVLLVALVSTALPQVRARFAPGADPFGYSRLEIWRASVALALASPLGVGLEGYADAMRTHGVALTGDVRYPRSANTAHSEPLNAWVELGAAGLAATLVPIALLLATLARRRRQGQAVAADLGVLAAFAVPAAVSASLHVLPVAVLAAAWAASIVGRDHEPGASVALPAQTRRGVALALALALLAAVPGALGFGLMLEAHRRRHAGDTASAARVAAAAATLMPWSLEAAMQRERYGLASGAPLPDVAEALVDLAEAYPDDPGPPHVVAGLLTHEIERGSRAPSQWSVVASFYQASAKRDPRNALRWVDVGRAELRANAPEQARDAFARAVAEEPNCAGAQAGLAYISEKQGDHPQAVAHKRLALAAAARANLQVDYARTVLSVDADAEGMLATVADTGP